MDKVKSAGARVREVRRGRAMTQSELAEKAGISADSVVKIEGGLHEPRASTTRALAAALGVEVERLTGYVD